MKLELFRTSLPMRSFAHAAKTRTRAEAVVVRLRSRAGRVGWGEALPRDYVTGETFESVAADIENIFWPILRRRHTDSTFAETVAELPCRDGDRVITAARCAVELAAIQAWELPWPGPTKSPGAGAVASRVTGVIGSADPRKTARKLRLMRLYGLRDFKLKLGFDDAIDRANLAAARRSLAGDLAAARCSLRVDANMAWKYTDTPSKVAELADLGVCAVEQPCRARPGRLADLAFECALPLIADESCLTADDADILFGAEGRVWLNLRLAKNGGLGPTLAIARKAAAERNPYVLGCLVGESGILSHAQRAFLAVAPPPMMVEGNYGRFLLRDDLTAPSPRFGYGGRLRIPADGKLSVRPRADKFRRYATLLKQLD